MTAVYQASRIKRVRATKAEMAERREALFDIVAEQQPMTVRQVFYQATVRGVIEKTEAGYAKVQTLLADMRRDGELPYQWLADNTRWMRKPTTYSGPEQALLRTARFYRKSLWDEAGAYVEVWLEKDALAGVVVDVTAEYDVPLMVSRGYASLSFLHSAAANMVAEGRPCYIYHFGDFDPSGVNAAEKIEETLNDLAPTAEIYFERIAVTPEQITRWDLPTRPTKISDSRSKSWGGGDESVELDAIEPDSLRAMVREVIEEHLPADELARLREIEAAERESMVEFVKGCGIECGKFPVRPIPPIDQTSRSQFTEGSLSVSERASGLGLSPRLSLDRVLGGSMPIARTLRRIDATSDRTVIGSDSDRTIIG